MKIVIVSGGDDSRTHTPQELSTKWCSPAATRWIHRHPWLYWHSLAGQKDRFAAFMKPYILQTQRELKEIRIELKNGDESQALSDLAHAFFGHRGANHELWTEQDGCRLHDYISAVTGYSVADVVGGSFADSLRIRPLDLLRMSCGDEGVFLAEQARIVGKRKALELQLAHASSETVVYNMTPDPVSMYFVACLVISIMTSAEFVLKIIKSSHAADMKGRAAQVWFIAASSAASYMAMGHTACQVAGLFMSPCAAASDKIKESKPESKPLGRARQIVENMAGAVQGIVGAGYYGFGTSFTHKGAPYLNAFMHELSPEERQEARLALERVVRPLVMLEHASPHVADLAPAPEGG